MQTQYLTKNRTYRNPKIITPEYVVVHSTGAGMVDRQTLFRAWNSASVSLSCHGMVDDTGGMLTLPVTYRAWHVGSKGNGISVGFEICEPRTIRYADSAHTKVNTKLYDPQNEAVLKDFIRRWENGVEMAAYLCRQTGLDANHVFCHAEMAAMGKATNHADVLHWFGPFGAQYGMDAFREAVARKLNGGFVTAPVITPG